MSVARSTFEWMNLKLNWTNIKHYKYIFGLIHRLSEISAKQNNFSTEVTEL